MTIHRIKIYDKNMNLKEIINEEQAEAHFYRNSAPKKTVRGHLLGGAPMEDKKCDFCRKPFESNLSYEKFCKSPQCKKARKQRDSKAQYQKQKLKEATCLTSKN